MTSCEKQNISLPNKSGAGNTRIFFDKNCNIPNDAFTEILQMYSVSNGINNSSQSSTINTVIRNFGASNNTDGSTIPESESANFFTIVDFDNFIIGLSFDKAGGMPRNSIETDLYTAELMNSTANESTKDFQVQVRILYKQNYISVNRGDVFIITSVYDSIKYEFSTTVQYQVQPKNIIQSRVWNKDYKSQKSLFKSDKSERSIKTCASNKPAKRLAEVRDKHYDKYNSLK
jgi:hypothetical protein